MSPSHVLLLVIFLFGPSSKTNQLVQTVLLFLARMSQKSQLWRKNLGTANTGGIKRRSCFLVEWKFSRLKWGVELDDDGHQSLDVVHPEVGHDRERQTEYADDVLDHLVRGSAQQYVPAAPQRLPDY